MSVNSSIKALDIGSVEVVELPHKQLPIQESSTPLPLQRSRWQRFWRHPIMMPYHRLVALVAFANIAFLYNGLFAESWLRPGTVELTTISNMVLGNFAIAILIRQQYVVNLLFWLATRAPTHWPLSIRWAFGKVYHFGGIHSGCAVAGTIWFAVFTVSLFSSASTNVLACF